MAESSANDSYDPRSVRQDPKPDAHHRDRNDHTDYQNDRNSARDRDRSPHRGGSRDYRQQPNQSTNYNQNQNQRYAQNNNYHRNNDNHHRINYNSTYNQRHNDRRNNYNNNRPQYRDYDRARGREQNYETPYQKEARKLKEVQRKEKVLKEGTENEEEDMMKMMGFGGFDSTKEKAVKSNQNVKETTGSYKPKERKYRQYMNRKGGFNRPLDKIGK